MGETTKTSGDIRVHNVSLHRRGKAEYGTLSLTKHHLTFTFAAESGKEHDLSKTVASANQNQPSATKQNESGQADTPVKSSATPNGTTTSDPRAHASDTPTKSQAVRSKARPKTIWIAYPMINYCVLRPSHLQTNTARLPVSTESSYSGTDENDLFPPTHGTNAYGDRLSTDSAHRTPYASPRRMVSPAPGPDQTSSQNESGRPPAIRIRCRDFQMMALHFHSSPNKAPDAAAREIFFGLRSRCCVNRIDEMLAFHFQCPKEELDAGAPIYDARKEFARMGIGEKAAEGPGSAWRISEINADYSFSATYPKILCVPRAVSDNLLKYGGVFRSRARIPSLAYLHFNGGSISRSSQPMVGLAGKRNPQDERLVSAIFSSHTPTQGSPNDSPPQLPTTSESDSPDDSDVPVVLTVPSADTVDDIGVDIETTPRKKIYGSTRRNYIVDARPRLNALANRTGGGGVEDVTNYMGSGDLPVEKIFLNIPNIHVMRASLEKVIDSFANSDYLDLPPNQDTLRKSGWLGHIQLLLEGSEMVARVVGLGGSHVLVHCSDGWDRTSQVSALAQLMLDPYYRTLVGFITLVQKDFLSYGHKFRDRNGIQGSEKWFEIENERIAPAKNREDAGGDGNSLNALGTKALSGAKNWFDKNRGALFRQQNSSREALNDGAVAPSPPPPNSVIHAPPISNTKEEKEHKTKLDEIAPIFHQFLDAVYQLQRQHPNSFEFNERFLLRLLYQVYSGQYGEFLFDNEKQRSEDGGKTPSVWAHFLARRTEFINPDFDARSDNAFLLPDKGADQRVEVRWWSNLFKRTDREMNVPRALAPAEPESLAAQNSTVSLTGSDSSQIEHADAPTYGFALKGAKSTPSFQAARESLTSTFSMLSTQPTPKGPTTDRPVPPAVKHETIMPLSNETQHEQEESATGSSTAAAATTTTTVEHSKPSDDSTKETSKPGPDEDDDPLGVTSSMKRNDNRGGLDFSAFASQNAFQER